MLTKDDVNILKNIMMACIKEGQKTETTNRPKRGYYKNTEKILYSYQKLKVKVETDKQDIEDLKLEQANKKTVHKITNPDQSDPDVDDEIRHKQKIRNRERAMLRSIKMIEQVERALSLINNDEYYQIVKMLYFEHKTIEEAAGIMYCSPRTIARHRTRLVNELIILFYGADALE